MSDAEDLIALAAMFPVLRPRIAEVMAEPILRVQAFADLMAGRITQKQYDLLRAGWDAKDLARRLELYGEVGPWQIDCQDCGRSFESEDLPQLYAQCSDFGEECDEDDEDED